VKREELDRLYLKWRKGKSGANGKARKCYEENADQYSWGFLREFIGFVRGYELAMKEQGGKVNGQ
jgi:hypothetical protein